MGLLESSSSSPSHDPSGDHWCNPKLSGDAFHRDRREHSEIGLRLAGWSSKLIGQAEVKNNTKGVSALIKRWKQEAGLKSDHALACLEPTGHYSDNVLATLLELQVPTWVAHPLEIKQRMGMVRGKNDKVDAVRIADFAMRHQDKKRPAGPTTLSVIELKQLLAFRDRLVVDARRHSVYNSDLHPCVAKPFRKVFKDYSRRSTERIKAMIKTVDRMIKEHIAQDSIMLSQYKLLL